MKTVKKNVPLAIIFWILAVGVAYLIFSFSCATGTESAAVSRGLLNLIIEYIGNFISHDILRKSAHFLEFAALGFFVGGGIRFTFGRDKIYIPLAVCLLYSVSDEIHQCFVPGRAGMVFDVFVDVCGSLIGILVLTLIIFLIHKITEKRQNFHNI